MPFYFPALEFFVFALLQISRSDDDSGRCRYALHVTDDGPVTLDVPVTIFAQLHCADNTTDYAYVFVDDIQRRVEVSGQESASTSFIFTKNPGFRTIKVAVYRSYFPIAETEISVQVEDYIQGALNFFGIVEDEKDNRYIGTDRKFNISLELYYPLYVLQVAEFSYSWITGEGRFTTDQPYKMHQFNEPGPQWIRVAVVGRIPSYDGSSTVRYKWGYFDGKITVKDTFSRINISGNTYLEHGQLLDLDISCDGSGPVEYCWKVLPLTENNTNLSCTYPRIVTECSFPILYYFRDSGHFLLTIYVNNMVTSLQRNVEVHIYDVSLRQQLSTVIIPLVCTVLVVIIIACAVVVHMRRNRSLNIEAADFDFMQMEETSVAVETPWEAMRRYLLHLIQVHCLGNSSDSKASSASYGAILANR